MRIALRVANQSDAQAIFDLKQRLRPPPGAAGNQGFLLGTSKALYEHFIAHDLVLVADAGASGGLVGFAIIMRHEGLMQSELMRRASHVHWETAFQQRFAAGRIAFFEQLGMLPDAAWRVYAKYLAFVIARQCFADHDALFTTVLQHPFVNTAALPFIHVAGFAHVGRVDETYPEYGRIVSDVYHVDKAGFERHCAQPKFQAFIARARRAGFVA